jgi:hypothetical protein
MKMVDSENYLPSFIIKNNSLIEYIGKGGK